MRTIDVLKLILTPSLEENADGQGKTEAEHVIYGQLIDRTQLERATHMEKHEQWEVKIPKTDKNATKGTVRVRKTEIPGKAVEYTLCIKTPNANGSKEEVVVPTTEDMFEQFKRLAESGMVKHRYFFPVSENAHDIPIVKSTDPGATPTPVDGDTVIGELKTKDAEVIKTPKETASKESVEDNVVDEYAAPQKFTKKPVEIDAIRWNGENIAVVQKFLNGDVETSTSVDITEDDGNELTKGELLIGTLEDGDNDIAKHVASPGDWIIRGTAGEYYPCKPDIFNDTYWRVSQPSVENEDLPPPTVDQGLIYEVDMFVKPDGTYHDWCKIDLEVVDLNAPLPPLPIQLENMISAPYGKRTNEEEVIVSGLYQSTFLTKNQFISASAVDEPKALLTEVGTATST